MIDPTPILAACGIPHPQQVTPVLGGADTLIWKVIDPSGHFALRLLRAEQADGWQRELAAMRLAADGGIPVPTVHQTLLWQDRPVILMDWCAGAPVLNWFTQRPWLIWRLCHLMGQMQAQIHRIVLPADWPQPADPWSGFADPRDPAIKQHLQQLPARPPTLLHLDFHPLNVLSDGKRITAVLDWTNARTGDPRADLARTYTIFRVDPWEGRSGPLWQLFRQVLSTAWRRGYEQVNGPVGDMALFYAWAGVVMVRDLSPRVQRPGYWLRQEHIDAIQRWTDEQKRAAGISGQ